MYNNKIIISLLPIIMAAVTGTSCSKGGHTQPKCIAPYLYELSYNDYVWDENEETIAVPEGSVSYNAGGCVALHKGNLFARNFDNPRHTMPDFVVHMAAKNGRHASLGMCEYNSMHTKDLEEGKVTQHQLDVLPTHTADGINDCGVCISSNLTRVGEGDEVDQNVEGRKRVNMCFIPRLVLDKASSAKEAVDLIKNVNACGIVHMNEEDPFHADTIEYLISDPNETYCVYFYNNETRFIKLEGKEQMISNFMKEKNPTMTKFGDEPGKGYSEEIDPDTHLHKGYLNYAGGIERYARVENQYDNITDASTMREAMKGSRFSNLYNWDEWLKFSDESEEYPWDAINGFWMSDVFTQQQLNAWANKDKSSDYYNEAKEVVDNLKALMPIAIQGFISGYRGDDFPCLITYHLSIYDMEKRTLEINAQENYDYTYTFHL